MNLTFSFQCMVILSMIAFAIHGYQHLGLLSFFGYILKALLVVAGCTTMEPNNETECDPAFGDGKSCAVSSLKSTANGITPGSDDAEMTVS